MKAFRINTDIKIKWTVSINGGTTPIEGTDLKLVVQSKARRQCLPFAIDGNTIVATFRGKDQVAEGTHSLTLWMNFNKDGQAALDHVDAFTLVPTTEQITDGSDSDNLLTDASVELTGELTAAVKGDSAYEIWLNHGFTGTVEDFLAWLKGPKGDPGTQGAPGDPGPAGNGIDHIALDGTSVDGKRDMYTIFFTNGNTFNFYVNHGKDASIDAYTKEQINALLDKKAGATSKVLSNYGGSESEMDTNLAITALSYSVINHYHDVDEALKDKVDNSRKVNGKTLDADISISGKDIPYGSGSDTIYQAFEALFASLRDSFDDIDSRFENLPSGAPEVHIGTDAPTGDEVLWIDPTEEVIVQTTGTATDKVMSQKAVTDAMATKQGTLTAGENITIKNNVISASGGGGGSDWQLIMNTTLTENVAQIVQDFATKVHSIRLLITGQVVNADGTKVATDLKGYVNIQNPFWTSVNNAGKTVNVDGRTYFIEFNNIGGKIIVTYANAMNSNVTATNTTSYNGNINADGISRFILAVDTNFFASGSIIKMWTK